MLENLTGTDGLPSPELIRDLQVLCNLERREIKALADVFSEIYDESIPQETSGAVLKKIGSQIVDPQKLSTSVKVAQWLWSRWARLALKREDIISDLRSIRISAEQITNLSPLLATMEEKLGVLQSQRAKSHALLTGTPRIDGASCIVETRAVFKSSKFEKNNGDQQPYFQVDHFEPLAILEIVSELNEQKSTRSYLLTEDNLDELIDILNRAKRRLQIVKQHLTHVSINKEEKNGSAI